LLVWGRDRLGHPLVRLALCVVRRFCRLLALLLLHLLGRRFCCAFHLGLGLARLVFLPLARLLLLGFLLLLLLLGFLFLLRVRCIARLPRVARRVVRRRRLGRGVTCGRRIRVPLLGDFLLEVLLLAEEALLLLPGSLVVVSPPSSSAAAARFFFLPPAPVSALSSLSKASRRGTTLGPLTGLTRSLACTTSIQRPFLASPSLSAAPSGFLSVIFLTALSACLWFLNVM